MPEPVDLEALVRAARPEPAPAWAGKMDRRVAERFPSPPRWWQWETVRPHLQAISAVGAVVVVFALIIGVASQSGGGSDDSASSGGGEVSTSAKSPNAAVPKSESESGAAGV